MEENTLGSYKPEAVDPEGKPVAFDVEGPDADKFTAFEAGSFQFKLPPNFESPRDANRDNVYELAIVADDGETKTRLNLRIIIRDVADSVHIRRVGTGFADVVSVNAIPGTDALLIAQKDGRVFRFNPASASRTLLFRVDDMLMDGGIGLLGASAAPGFGKDGALLVTFINNDGNLWLHRYAPDSLGNYVGSSGPMLSISAPNRQRPGGWIGLSSDDELYALLSADGKSGAANPDGAVSKVLRLVRNSDPNAGSGQPFYVASPHNAMAASTSMAEGLRNPWGGAFHNGNFLFFDRGGKNPDEVNILSNIDDPQEGYVNFDNGYSCRDCNINVYIPGRASPNLILEKDLLVSENNILIGGVVFTGAQSSLAGHYLLADAVDGTMLSVDVDDLIAPGEGGSILRPWNLLNRTGDFIPDAGTLGPVRAFGKDRGGRAYMADAEGQLFSINE